ncbi:MAG: hypothetical protein H6650_16780 [Ardenticatenales bacterium]|nr:hypothetical protein [Ardenticatenales bacterium]
MKTMRKLWLRLTALLMMALLTGAVAASAFAANTAAVGLEEASGILPGWVGWLVLGLALLLSLGGWVWYRQAK